ncbi:hypothetical protein ACFQZ4_16215 [Catellatospora coxensis]
MPVPRVGMASGTADLQRDLGGAIMQSVLGALLTAGYVRSISTQVRELPQSPEIAQAVVSELQKSFASAADTAQRYPRHAAEIIEGARNAFLAGDRWAYSAAIIAILLGMALVARYYPRHPEENRLLASYQDEDGTPAGAPTPARGAG